MSEWTIKIFFLNSWPSVINQDDAFHKTAFARLAKQGDANYLDGWI